MYMMVHVEVMYTCVCFTYNWINGDVVITEEEPLHINVTLQENISRVYETYIVNCAQVECNCTFL